MKNLWNRCPPKLCTAGEKLNIKKNILIGTIRSIIGAMVHTIIPNRCKWEQFPAQQYN